MKKSVNLLLSLFFFTALLGQEKTSVVNQAYQLRLNGMADSARTVLENHLENDPNCAVCWYELFRTHQHMALSKPQKWADHEKEIESAINNAIKYAPENPYYVFCRGKLQSFQIYIALNSGEESVSEMVDELGKTYQEVVSMDPEYYPVYLSLVEFYYLIPEEMGGSHEKAKDYADQLKKMDPVYYARAEEVLMPEDADYVAFWQNIVSGNPDRYEAQEALGRVYLYEDEVEKARACFEKVIATEPERTDLYLDLARYYLMTAMWGKTSLDSIAPSATIEFDRYLESKPEPYNPIRAWVLNMKAMMYYRTGNEEEGQQYKKESADLDPWHPVALGKPDNQLFCPPEEQKPMVGYFFRPF
jgi:tetratricopeptide (TPR) repeat protein